MMNCKSNKSMHKHRHEKSSDLRLIFISSVLSAFLPIEKSQTLSMHTKWTRDTIKATFIKRYENFILRHLNLNQPSYGFLIVSKRLQAQWSRYNKFLWRKVWWKWYREEIPRTSAINKMFNRIIFFSSAF